MEENASLIKMKCFLFSCCSFPSYRSQSASGKLHYLRSRWLCIAALKFSRTTSSGRFRSFISPSVIYWYSGYEAVTDSRSASIAADAVNKLSPRLNALMISTHTACQSPADRRQQLQKQLLEGCKWCLEKLPRYEVKNVQELQDKL